MPALSFPPAIFLAQAVIAPGPSTLGDTCHDIDGCRTVVAILRGCLSTIASIYLLLPSPNVPKTRRDEKDVSFFKTPLQWAWRSLTDFYPKLVMLLVALVAPELIFGLAFRQYLKAKQLAQKYELPKTHAWLLVMGGFVTSTGTPIVSESQINLYLDAIRSYNVADLKDKSKADLLSKIISLGQLLWFIQQLASRVFFAKLPLSELEIATFAFAIIPVLTWAWWKDKPKDVVEAIRLPSATFKHLKDKEDFASPQSVLPRADTDTTLVSENQDSDSDTETLCRLKF
ncbi:hypothetical protein C8F01DRAFT_1377782 [Mycena amicta]|nr:hypothetical protein C8F01DRAFT_1377782 [Mycena amicta]